jgi:predicted oxidoreductase
MCRALVVVCAAPDRESLMALKRAAVGSEWELSPGATTDDEAIAEIEERLAHVLVVSGGVGDVVSRARERWPGLRIVVVAPPPGPTDATVVVGSLDEVRGAVMGLPSPGGPVRA